jgi:hypothetical protein
VYQPVEGGQQRGSPRERLAELRRVDSPLAFDAFDDGGLAGLANVDRFDRTFRSPGAGDAQGSQPPFVADATRLACGDHRVIGVDPCRQVPQPLAAPSSSGRDFAPQHHELQQLGDVAVCSSIRSTPTAPCKCPEDHARSAAPRSQADQGCPDDRRRWPSPSRGGAPASRAAPRPRATRPSPRDRAPGLRWAGSSPGTRATSGPRAQQPTRSIARSTGLYGRRVGHQAQRAGRLGDSPREVHVAVAQSRQLVRQEAHVNARPAQVDVRMLVRGIGQFADPAHQLRPRRVGRRRDHALAPNARTRQSASSSDSWNCFPVILLSMGPPVIARPWFTSQPYDPKGMVSAGVNLDRPEHWVLR